jgi:hypothetical protein
MPPSNHYQHLPYVERKIITLFKRAVLANQLPSIMTVKRRLYSMLMKKVWLR